MGSRTPLSLIRNEKDSLLADLSQIAQDLNPNWATTETLDKFRRLFAEIRLNTQNPDLNQSDKLEILKNFFFQEKVFSSLVSKPKLDKYLLPYALLSRKGPEELLLLVFVGISQALNLPLSVVECRSKMVLKFIDQGRSVLLDFNKQCQPLSTEDVIALVNADINCTEPLSKAHLISSYLLKLKQQAIKERSFVKLYKIQSHLIHYQPFVLNHLVDRARASYAIGDLTKVAEDLGQYLTYHSDKVTNNKFSKLIRKLNKEKISLLSNFKNSKNDTQV